MSLLNALILGIIQGVAEFLPISSSGHLSIAQNLLGLGVEGADDVFFDVLLHLGTLGAVFAAYWADIREMALEFFRMIRDVAGGRVPQSVPPARRLILLIVAGTLPLFLVLPFQKKVESLYGNTFFVGGALVVTGILLFFCDRIPKGRKNAKNASIVDVLIVGAGQAVATCPGISRSGTTITAGCFVGFDRKFAVRYSFLMSIPAILGANILSLKDALEAGILWEEVPVYLVGVAVSAAVGYLCIRLIKLVADKGRFGFFAWYCWLAGIVTLALIFTQT